MIPQIHPLDSLKSHQRYYGYEVSQPNWICSFAALALTTPAYAVSPAKINPRSFDYFDETGVEITGIDLVARFSQIEGYRCLSLTRAFGVVKCQLAVV